MSSGAHKRRKGGNGERELIRRFRQLGYPHELHRGDQDTRARECDVEGAPHFWVECKRRGVTRAMHWNGFFQQAKEDAEKANDIRSPVVIGRVDRGEWEIHMKFTDFMVILRQAMFHLER